MPFRHLGLSRIPTSAVMLAVSGLAVLGMAVGTPSTQLERELQQALSTLPATASQQASARTKTVTPQLAGSEDFWLSSFSGDHGQNIVPAVAIGDSITVTSAGAERTLRVTDISEISSQDVTRIETSGHRARMFVVTGQDTSVPSSKPIRFFMEMDNGSVDMTSVKINRSL